MNVLHTTVAAHTFAWRRQTRPTSRHCSTVSAPHTTSWRTTTEPVCVSDAPSACPS